MNHLNMKKRTFLLTLMLVLLGSLAEAKSFLDTLETRSQLPCNIQEYQQLNRQRLATKTVKKQLPLVSVAQKPAEYYSLGKVVLNECTLLLIEQKYKDNGHIYKQGYICKLEETGKGTTVTEKIHIVDDLKKEFMIDGRKIIVSQIDTVKPTQDHLTYGPEIESYNLPDSYPVNVNGYEYVDLGLSVLWATKNIGASTEEESGHFFAWGETVTKRLYDIDNYKFGWYTLSKYVNCNSSSMELSDPDSLTMLEPIDDAAVCIWGAPWRMPTNKEYIELVTECEWIWTPNYKGKDVNGYIVRGKTGNEIFLPCAGSIGMTGENLIANQIGSYWTSMLHINKFAYEMCFAVSMIDTSLNSNHRYMGKSIRPVIDRDRRCHQHFENVDVGSNGRQSTTSQKMVVLIEGKDFEVSKPFIVLSDTAVKRLREVQLPIIKFIGVNGEQLVVSQGLCYVCSGFPDSFFYYLDEDNRVRIVEGNRFGLGFGRLKTSEIPSWLIRDTYENDD